MSKSVECTRRELFEHGMRHKLFTEGYDSRTLCLIMEFGTSFGYTSLRVANAWEGFNIALDAVEIDLEPAIRTVGGGPIDGSMYTSEVYKAIESLNLGIKIRT